ncbi:MBL fold metallo-hydrolase [Candidatus Woesearchaeota archaeon]|nr:MBL fold metallo-hydrolase [Candidatus Woesearchaeota archaeon]
MQKWLLLLLLTGCTTANLILDLPIDTPTTYGEGILTLTMFDVGQGQAILIRLPEGETILYDAAKSGERLTSHLKNASITTLDYAIISNLDADHAAGLIKGFDVFTVKHYLQPSVPCDTKTCASLNAKAAAEGSTLLDWHDGDAFVISGARIDVLNPDAPLAFSGDNDNSIVLKLTYKNVSILLPGDCELKCEDALVEQYGNRLQSDVYIAGHHGSKTSSSKPFVDSINPELALVSVGKTNQYGHPAPAVIDRLNQTTNGYVFRTDESGTLTVTTDGQTIEVRDAKGIIAWVAANP